jgi:predicted RNase H-like HicB family nuclease
VREHVHSGERALLSLVVVLDYICLEEKPFEGLALGSRGRRKKMRQVIIYPGEDGYWVAECPTLPGCISQGETREKAIKNIREAIDAYIAALKEDGLSVPEERFDLLTVVV